MLEILSKRYSGRSYDFSKEISKSQLLSILEAGRLAPSCYNEQPWYFIACDHHSHPDGYEKILSSLVEGNRTWAKNAPVLIVSIAGSKFARNGKLNRWGQHDTGAASFSMMLEATNLGLMAHQMGGFDEVAIKQKFDIPDDCTPMAVMAIGYPTADESQPPRERKPFEQNFFFGSWQRKM